MDSDAGVSVHADYDLAHFYFNNSFIENTTASELDETILHEWVHVAFRDYDNAVKLSKPWFPDAAWETFDRNIDHHKETIVDRMAKTLYAFYEH